MSVNKKASPGEKLSRNATDEGSLAEAWNERYRNAERKIPHPSLASSCHLPQGEGSKLAFRQERTTEGLPYEAAPRFHSASPRAFPSCHPERSEAKSNCEAASNKVQTGSPTEKFDKLRMTRSGKKQHPRLSAVLYRNKPKWIIISWSRGDSRIARQKSCENQTGDS